MVTSALDCHYQRHQYRCGVGWQSTPNLLEAQLNRLMVNIAARVVAVCDSSKFGRSSLSSIVPIANIHGVITDKQIPKADLRALKKAGLEITPV